MAITGASRFAELETDVAFLELFARAEVYAATWWLQHSGPHVQRLDSCHGLREALQTELRFSSGPVSTERIYRALDGWDLERVEWQSETLRTTLEGFARSPTRLPPLAFVTLGLPGSGKSSVLRRIAKRFAEQHGVKEEAWTCDPDEIRVLFPEYHRGHGSLIVQAELVHMVYGDDDASAQIAHHCPTLASTSLGEAVLLFDTVGHPEHTPRLVRQLGEAGWRVHLLLASCPAATAMLRTKRRALECGRIVDPKYVQSAIGRPEKVFELCREETLAGWAVVDTEQLADLAPTLLESDPVGTFGQAQGAVMHW